MFDGVREFLLHLQRLKIPYAVATAGPAELVGFFDRCPEIRPAAFVSCDDVQSSKPDPAVYLEAMRRIGVSAEKCIIFEDSSSGIVGARNTISKLCGVFISEFRPELAEKCDYHITNWR